MRTFSLMLLLVLTTLFLPACASSSNAPVQAVQDYLNALVEKDENRLTTLSCSDWENDAILALDSYQAVSTRLEGLACEQTGTDGNTALVLCTGSIVATYDNEDQQTDLSTHTYEVVQEGGEWLVCGMR